MRTLSLLLGAAAVGLAAATQTSISSSLPTNTFDNCYPINSEYGVQFEWTLNADDTMDARITANVAGGYVALALIDPDGTSRFTSTNPDHPNNEPMDVWGVSDGDSDSADCKPGCVVDAYMTSDEASTDGSNDFTDVALYVDGDVMVGDFSRALATGDSEDLDIVPGTPIGVIYGCHPTKGAKDADDLFDEHRTACRGVLEIDFGNTYSCTSDSGAGSFTSTGGEVALYWEITDGATITFTLVNAGTGYASISWGGTGSTSAHGMKNDVITAWVSGGVPTLIDAYMNGQNVPVPDGQDDLTLVSSEETGGVTTVVFTRPLDTGDADDVPITDETVNLYWAVGNSDGTSTTSYAQHNARGTGQANLQSSGDTVATDDGTGGGDDGGGSTGGAAAAPGGFTTDDGTIVITFGLSDDLTAITFSLVGSTTGYMAVGWGAGAGHTGSDMIALWVDDTTGEVTCLDGYSSSLSQPVTDGQQDCFDVSGSQSAAGVTTVTFSRLLDTGDSADRVIADEEVYFFWAHLGSDSYAYHAARGTVMANLYSGEVTVLSSTFADAGEALVVIMCSVVGVLATVRWTRRAIKHHRRLQRRKNKGAPGAKTADVELVPPESQRASRRFDPAAIQAQVINPLATADHGQETVPQRPSSQRYDPQSFRRGHSYSVSYSNDKQLTSIDDTFSSSDYVAKEEDQLLKSVLHGVLVQKVPRCNFSVGAGLVGAAYIALNLLLVYVFNNELWLPRNSFGALTSANALFVVLPATRNSVLTWVLGMPFDHTIMYHRFLGRWTMFLVTMHFFLYLGEADLSLTTNKWGIAGWCMCVVVLISSINFLRRRHFEFFYAMHFVFVLFYLFGSYHNEKFAPYALAAGVFYGFDRLLRFFWGAWPTKTTVLKVKPGEILQIRYKKHPLAQYKAGSYVFINFPAISLLEWHPFTISSGEACKEAEIHIKGLGGFTKKLLAAAERSGGSMWVRVDGPYGHLEHNFRRYKAIFLVGGGVGITPMIALLKTIYRPGGDFGVVKDVFFVWVCKSHDDFSWFRDVLDECIEQAETNERLPRLSVWVYMTREETSDHPNVVCGRPDMSVLFDTATAAADTTRFACFTCGPGMMVDAVWNEAAARSRSGVRFDLHSEVFEF